MNADMEDSVFRAHSFTPLPGLNIMFTLVTEKTSCRREAAAEMHSGTVTLRGNQTFDSHVPKYGAPQLQLNPQFSPDLLHI